MNLPKASPAPSTQILAAVHARTPARVFAGRAGPSYRTATQLGLRLDHAAARDAVYAELDLARDLGDLVGPFQLFEVTTHARTKAEFLLRPDLGRRLDDEARDRVARDCPAGRDLQVVVG